MPQPALTATRTIIRDLPGGCWSYPLRLIRVRQEHASVEWHLEAFRPGNPTDDEVPWSYGVCGRFATRKDALAHLTLLVTGGREAPSA